MPISDKNIKYEAALYAVALGLLSEMDEVDRGISQDLGREEIFQKLTADLSDKLKFVLLKYTDTKRTWHKKLKVSVTSV